MQKDYSQFRGRDVELAAISVDRMPDAARMAALVGADYPVLSDPDAEAVRAYGVFDLLDDGVAAPAVFIVAKDGAIVWRYVGVDIGDRPSSRVILEQLEKALR